MGVKKVKKHFNCGRKRPDLAELNRKTKRKHGMHNSPTYVVWSQMKQRCLNKKDKSYYRYGGADRGLCKRWEKFELFLKDMGVRPPGHQIDRIDNSKGYKPSNCRWVTPSENCKNRGRVIKFRNKNMYLVEWCRFLGLSIPTVRGRLNRGWSIKDALTVKPSSGNRWKGYGLK